MNIKFANEAAFNRFCDRFRATENMENSLGKCLMRLMLWNPWDSDCIVSCDFDEPSFFFQEVRKDGSKGMCGGIIFHGRRDNGGDGSAPTFSVCLSPCDGYSIHT